MGKSETQEEQPSAAKGGSR